MKMRCKITLQDRLQMIYKKIPKCSILCDIGTDHGLISILSVLEGKAQKCIATDISEGPLKVGRKNANRYNTFNVLEFRCGDGLEPLNEVELDTVVIAGMGGELIATILAASINKAVLAKCLILQPMNSVEAVRRFLYGNGFDIFDEELCVQGNKLYNVICAKHDGIRRKKQLIDIHVGEILRAKFDPLCLKLMQKKLRDLEKAYNDMKKSKSDGIENISDLSGLIESLKDEINHMQMK